MVIAFTAVAAAGSVAAAKPEIHVASSVRVGFATKVTLDGYRAGSRVSLGAQADKFRGSNTEAIRLGRPTYVIPRSGRLTVVFPWPAGYYVGCTAVGCPDPPTPWRSGELADISAADLTGNQFADTRATVIR
jgi:hypothetical protein